jgi:hypothetical protein
MGAFTAPGSKTGAGAAWLVGTPRHFTPSVALARSLGPPASSPAGAAEDNKPILPCSSSPHTVGSLALSHTGGGAVSVNRGAAEVITDLINIDDELKILLDNNDKSKLEIITDDTPYNNRYKKRFVKVIEIIDNYSFKIDKELKKYEKIFVYGKKVNVFKRLDYQSLYCLNIAATQELYKSFRNKTQL